MIFIIDSQIFYHFKIMVTGGTPTSTPLRLCASAPLRESKSFPTQAASADAAKK
jgi:hypothetical protein